MDRGEESELDREPENVSELSRYDSAKRNSIPRILSLPRESKVGTHPGNEVERVLGDTFLEPM